MWPYSGDPHILSMMLLCHFQNTEGRFWLLTQHCGTKEYWGVNRRPQKWILLSSCCCSDVEYFPKGLCIKGLVPREVLDSFGNLKRLEEVRYLGECPWKIWRHFGSLSFPICSLGSWFTMVLLYHVPHVVFCLSLSSKAVGTASDQLKSLSCDQNTLFFF